ncbi:Transcriptional regulatory protein pcoR [Klebsiella pneumoniae]|nr:Transcriptional regulatory protein pcoR [Klebsiella pneumoniae]
MPAFEWVHVQLHQQKGMISLSPPTICNSAPRSLISSLVWNMNFDSDTNVIDVAVRRLRSKIDDDFEPKLIHTVRGAGYVLEIREE